MSSESMNVNVDVDFDDLESEVQATATVVVGLFRAFLNDLRESDEHDEELAVRILFQFAVGELHSLSGKSKIASRADLNEQLDGLYEMFDNNTEDVKAMN